MHSMHLYKHTHTHTHTQERLPQASGEILYEISLQTHHTRTQHNTHTHTHTDTQTYTDIHTHTHTHTPRIERIERIEHAHEQARFPQATGEILHQIAQGSQSDKNDQKVSINAFSAFCNRQTISAKMLEMLAQALHANDDSKPTRGCFGSFRRVFGLRGAGSRFSKVVPVP